MVPRLDNRLLAFGQVVGVWLVISLICSFLLGHGSAFAIIPMIIQAIVGSLLHGILVLTAPVKFLVSTAGACVVGLAATLFAFGASKIYWSAGLNDMADAWRVLAIVVIVAQACALAAWYCLRREVAT